MATNHEIALVRAQGSTVQDKEVYWIFSRAQVEFLLKGLDLVDSSEHGIKARYQEMILPVLSLEDHFDIREPTDSVKDKYIVVRSVDGANKLQRLIVSNSSSPQFQVADSSFSPLADFSLPAHSEHILGAYSFAGEKVGVVPDIAGICLELS